MESKMKAIGVDEEEDEDEEEDDLRLVLLADEASGFPRKKHKKNELTSEEIAEDFALQNDFQEESEGLYVETEDFQRMMSQIAESVGHNAVDDPNLLITNWLKVDIYGAEEGMENRLEQLELGLDAVKNQMVNETKEITEDDNRDRTLENINQLQLEIERLRTEHARLSGSKVVIAPKPDNLPQVCSRSESTEIEPTYRRNTAKRGMTYGCPNCGAKVKKEHKCPAITYVKEVGVQTSITYLSGKHDPEDEQKKLAKSDP